MKNFRFSLMALSIYLFLVPQKSHATCFFDRDGMQGFYDQCDSFNGVITTTFSPPAFLVLTCTFPDGTGGFNGGVPPLPAMELMYLRRNPLVIPQEDQIIASRARS